MSEVEELLVEEQGQDLYSDKGSNRAESLFEQRDVRKKRCGVRKQSRLL